MAVLEGTHGTSFSRSREIAANGFRLGMGRGGTGAYFWRAGRYAEYLAVAWYNSKKSEGEYRGDEHPGCAVIFVKLSVSNTELLNAESHGFKDRLATIAEKWGIGESTKQIASLFDWFISELEKDLKIRYKVVELRVAPPPLEFRREYRIKLLGAPLCYVARDPSCVSVESIRRPSDAAPSRKI